MPGRRFRRAARGQAVAMENAEPIPPVPTPVPEPYPPDDPLPPVPEPVPEPYPPPEIRVPF